MSLSEDKGRANELATRMGVDIPGEIHISMWSLPLLEKLNSRVEELEREVRRIAYGGDDLRIDMNMKEVKK